MAYSIISKPSLYFNTKLYTGNGSTQSITGVGFQPDYTWIKTRSGTGNHMNQDSVRGSTKHLHINTGDVEVTDSNGVTSFDSDGFSVGTNGNVNGNGTTIASWNWKAGTTGSGTSTGSGTGKAYSYSVNTTSGFSIVKYIGNGTAGHTIPHHLGQAPTWTIVKALGNNEAWQIISSGLAADKFIQHNTDGELSQGTYNMFNSTRPSSTVVTLGDQNHTNQNNYDYIMYNFCNIKGFSKSGSYVGNGNADGPFVYTGFKPAFLYIKRTTSQAWVMFDSKRSDIANANPNDQVLFPSGSDAELSSVTRETDTLSNGFKFRATGGNINASGETYIYLAFADEPLVANVGESIPATAR